MKNISTVQILEKLGACGDGLAGLQHLKGITPKQAWNICQHGGELAWLLMRVDYHVVHVISMLRGLLREPVEQLPKKHQARAAFDLVDGWLHEGVTLAEVKKARTQVRDYREEIIASIPPGAANSVHVADIHAITVVEFLLETIVNVEMVDKARSPQQAIGHRVDAARYAHNALWRGAEALAARATTEVVRRKRDNPSPRLEAEPQPQAAVHIYEGPAGDADGPTLQMTQLENGRTRARFKRLSKKVSDAVITKLRKGYDDGRLHSFQLRQDRDIQALREIGVESFRWDKDMLNEVTVTITVLQADMPKVLEVLGFTQEPLKKEEAAAPVMPPTEVYGGDDARVELKFVPKDEPVSFLSIPTDWVSMKQVGVTYDSGSIESTVVPFVEESLLPPGTDVALEAAKARSKENANGDSFYATPLEVKLEAYASAVRRADQVSHAGLEKRGDWDSRPILQATLLLGAEDRLKLTFHEVHRDLRSAIVDRLQRSIQKGRLTHLIVREQCEEGRSTTPDVGRLAITLSCKEFSDLLFCFTPILRVQLANKAVWGVYVGDDGGPEIPVQMTHFLSVPVLESISRGKRTDWFAKSLRETRGRVVALGLTKDEKTSTTQVTQAEVNEAFGADDSVVQLQLQEYAGRLQSSQVTQEFRKALEEMQYKPIDGVFIQGDAPKGWDVREWERHYMAVQTTRPYNEPDHPQNVRYRAALKEYAEKIRAGVDWSEVEQLLHTAVTTDK